MSSKGRDVLVHSRAQRPAADAAHGASSGTPATDDTITRLIAQYGDALRRYLHRRLDGHADEVEDNLQETWLRLLVYRDRDPHSLEAPQALVYRVAESVLQDRHRRRSVRHADGHRTLGDLDLASSEPSQERRASAEQEVLLLRQAIRELPPKCKQAFLLSRLRKLSYAQIAAQMGISVKMVEKHITHALALCRQKVGGRAQ